ncbi:MAG: hypothetical protein C4530_20320 [Desulfobacteraceae bacterium]|nr:MAG: hypothetical protein C4530_20320 [Desulfobacteraceae bacterium]
MQIERCRFGFSAVPLLAGALLLLGGCSAQETPPEKPVVVTKKISSRVSPPAVNVASASQKDVAPSPEKIQGTDDRKTGISMPQNDPPTGAAIEKEGVESPAEEFAPLYSPEGKIDPFAPLIREKNEVSVEKREKNKRIPQTPLEKMDLSQVKLTAIIVAPNGNKALVEEAGGKGYIVSKGTYIGLHSGVVTEISKNCVTVEEELEDIFGKIKRESKELTLQKQPGEP